MGIFQPEHQSGEQAAITTTVACEERFPRPAVPADGLVLYYHPHNFFSQKILIALHEKRIPFTAQLVDIQNGEQYTPWFLELNPKGEVPVLQNGVQIIPESGRILGYLEDHFTSVRLLPREQKTTVLERILYFNRLIARLPVSAITMGVFLHPDVSGVACQPPMDRVTGATIAATNRTVRSVIQSLAERQHPLGEALLQRNAAQERRCETLAKRSEFEQLLGSVHGVLTEVEAHLRDQQTAWLCCEQFTVADVSLAVLLHRLNVLGLAELLWSQPQQERPNVAQYVVNVMRRDSFQRIVDAEMTVETSAAAMAAAAKAVIATVDKHASMLPANLLEAWSRVSPTQVAAAVTALTAVTLMVLAPYVTKGN